MSADGDRIRDFNEACDKYVEAARISGLVAAYLESGQLRYDIDTDENYAFMRAARYHRRQQSRNASDAEWMRIAIECIHAGFPPKNVTNPEIRAAKLRMDVDKAIAR